MFLHPRLPFLRNRQHRYATKLSSTNLQYLSTAQTSAASKTCRPLSVLTSTTFPSATLLSLPAPACHLSPTTRSPLPAALAHQAIAASRANLSGGSSGQSSSRRIRFLAPTLHWHLFTNCRLALLHLRLSAPRLHLRPSPPSRRSHPSLGHRGPLPHPMLRTNIGSIVLKTTPPAS